MQTWWADGDSGLKKLAKAAATGHRLPAGGEACIHGNDKGVMGEMAPATLIMRTVLSGHSVVPHLKHFFQLLHGLSFWLKFPSDYSLSPSGCWYLAEKQSKRKKLCDSHVSGTITRTLSVLNHLCNNPKEYIP